MINSNNPFSLCLGWWLLGILLLAFAARSEKQYLNAPVEVLDFRWGVEAITVDHASGDLMLLSSVFDSVLVSRRFAHANTLSIPSFTFDSQSPSSASLPTPHQETFPTPLAGFSVHGSTLKALKASFHRDFTLRQFIDEQKADDDGDSSLPTTTIHDWRLSAFAPNTTRLLYSTPQMVALTNDSILFTSTPHHGNTGSITLNMRLKDGFSAVQLIGGGAQPFDMSMAQRTWRGPTSYQLPSTPTSVVYHPPTMTLWMSACGNLDATGAFVVAEDNRHRCGLLRLRGEVVERMSDVSATKRPSSEVFASTDTIFASDLNTTYVETYKLVLFNDQLVMMNRLAPDFASRPNPASIARMDVSTMMNATTFSLQAIIGGFATDRGQATRHLATRVDAQNYPIDAIAVYQPRCMTAPVSSKWQGAAHLANGYRIVFFAHTADGGRLYLWPNEAGHVVTVGGELSASRTPFGSLPAVIGTSVMSGWDLPSIFHLEVSNSYLFILVNDTRVQRAPSTPHFVGSRSPKTVLVASFHHPAEDNGVVPSATQEEDAGCSRKSHCSGNAEQVVGFPAAVGCTCFCHADFRGNDCSALNNTTNAPYRVITKIPRGPGFNAEAANVTMIYHPEERGTVMLATPSSVWNISTGASASVTTSVVSGEPSLVARQATSSSVSSQYARYPLLDPTTASLHAPRGVSSVMWMAAGGEFLLGIGADTLQFRSLFAAPHQRPSKAALSSHPFSLFTPSSPTMQKGLQAATYLPLQRLLLLTCEDGVWGFNGTSPDLFLAAGVGHQRPCSQNRLMWEGLDMMQYLQGSPGSFFFCDATLIEPSPSHDTVFVVSSSMKSIIQLSVGGYGASGGNSDVFFTRPIATAGSGSSSLPGVVTALSAADSDDGQRQLLFASCLPGIGARTTTIVAVDVTSKKVSQIYPAAGGTESALVSPSALLITDHDTLYVFDRHTYQLLAVDVSAIQPSPTSNLRVKYSSSAREKLWRNILSNTTAMSSTVCSLGHHCSGHATRVTGNTVIGCVCWCVSGFHGDQCQHFTAPPTFVDGIDASVSFVGQPIAETISAVTSWVAHYVLFISGTTLRVQNVLTGRHKPLLGTPGALHPPCTTHSSTKTALLHDTFSTGFRGATDMIVDTRRSAAIGNTTTKQNALFIAEGFGNRVLRVIIKESYVEAFLAQGDEAPHSAMVDFADPFVTTPPRDATLLVDVDVVAGREDCLRLNGGATATTHHELVDGGSATQQALCTPQSLAFSAARDELFVACPLNIVVVTLEANTIRRLTGTSIWSTQLSDLPVVSIYQDDSFVLSQLNLVDATLTIDDALDSNTLLLSGAVAHRSNTNVVLSTSVVAAVNLVTSRWQTIAVADEASTQCSAVVYDGGTVCNAFSKRMKLKGTKGFGGLGVANSELEQPTDLHVPVDVLLHVAETDGSVVYEMNFSWTRSTQSSPSNLQHVAKRRVAGGTTSSSSASIVPATPAHHAQLGRLNSRLTYSRPLLSTLFVQEDAGGTSLLSRLERQRGNRTLTVSMSRLTPTASATPSWTPTVTSTDNTTTPTTTIHSPTISSTRPTQTPSGPTTSQTVSGRTGSCTLTHHIKTETPTITHSRSLSHSIPLPTLPPVETADMSHGQHVPCPVLSLTSWPALLTDEAIRTQDNVTLFLTMPLTHRWSRTVFMVEKTQLQLFAVDPEDGGQPDRAGWNASFSLDLLGSPLRLEETSYMFQPGEIPGDGQLTYAVRIPKTPWYKLTAEEPIRAAVLPSAVYGGCSNVNVESHTLIVHPTDTSSIAALSAISTAAAVGSLASLAVGSGPATLCQAQVVALFSKMKCSLPGDRVAAEAAIFFFSPFSGFGNIGILAGNVGAGAGALALHGLLIAVFHKKQVWRRVPIRDVCATLRYPQYPLIIALILHSGACFTAFALLFDTSDAMNIASGLGGGVYAMGLPILAVLLQRRLLHATFMGYPKEFYEDAKAGLRRLLPQGVWGPDGPVFMFGSLFTGTKKGSQNQWILHLVLLITIPAALASIRINAENMSAACGIQMGIMGGLYGIFGGMAIVKRFLRYPLGNFFTAATLLLLGIHCISKAVAMVQPFTPTLEAPDEGTAFSAASKAATITQIIHGVMLLCWCVADLVGYLLERFRWKAPPSAKPSLSLLVRLSRGNWRHSWQDSVDVENGKNAATPTGGSPDHEPVDITTFLEVPKPLYLDAEDQLQKLLLNEDQSARSRLKGGAAYGMGDDQDAPMLQHRRTFDDSGRQRIDPSFLLHEPSPWATGDDDQVTTSIVDPAFQPAVGMEVRANRTEELLALEGASRQQAIMSAMLESHTQVAADKAKVEEMRGNGEWLALQHARKRGLVAAPTDLLHALHRQDARRQAIDQQRQQIMKREMKRQYRRRHGDDGAFSSSSDDSFVGGGGVGSPSPQRIGPLRILDGPLPRPSASPQRQEHHQTEASQDRADLLAVKAAGAADLSVYYHDTFRGMSEEVYQSKAEERRAARRKEQAALKAKAAQVLERAEQKALAGSAPAAGTEVLLKSIVKKEQTKEEQAEALRQKKKEERRDRREREVAERLKEEERREKQRRWMGADGRVDGSSHLSQPQQHLANPLGSSPRRMYSAAEVW